MNDLALLFLSALVLGLGATLTLDLWTLFLQHAVGIRPSNFCLVGRWLRYMPEGTFLHSNIASAPPKRAECTIGWIAHYGIGITFAAVFLVLAGEGWLQHPMPLPALLFGVVTVLAPFLILQPALGLGFAASKAANPGQARWRSLMNHMVFGLGLYLFAWLTGWWLLAPA